MIQETMDAQVLKYSYLVLQQLAIESLAFQNQRFTASMETAVSGGLAGPPIPDRCSPSGAALPVVGSGFRGCSSASPQVGLSTAGPRPSSSCPWQF